MGYDWNVRNRDRKRAYDRRYRIEQWRNARRVIFDRDEYRCVYCREVFPESQLNVDHKEPEKGGWQTLVQAIRDDASRFVTACGPCNKRKGRKSYTLFMAIMQPDREPDWITESGSVYETCEVSS